MLYSFSILKRTENRRKKITLQNHRDMLWLVKRGLGFLLRFFFRSVKAAMRCFFGNRDDNRHPPPPLFVSNPPRSTAVTLSPSTFFQDFHVLLSISNFSFSADFDIVICKKLWKLCMI